MHEVDELQTKYIDEMRSIQKELLPWWLGLIGSGDPNDTLSKEVATNWPYGISGHPRALAIFRRYFLELEKYNDLQLAKARERLSQKRAPQQTDWGTEKNDELTNLCKPVDILILDIEELAPDIAKLVCGIVFVPVGLNQHNESV